MLTRIRIEVEEDSAAATEEALAKYEHALQAAEVQRYAQVNESVWTPWVVKVVNRDFFNDVLGREVTEEIIAYDSTLPGYRGRRVVRFTRLDTR